MEMQIQSEPPRTLLENSLTSLLKQSNSLVQPPKTGQPLSPTVDHSESQLLPAVDILKQDILFKSTSQPHSETNKEIGNEPSACKPQLSSGQFSQESPVQNGNHLLQSKMPIISPIVTNSLGTATSNMFQQNGTPIFPGLVSPQNQNQAPPHMHDSVDNAENLSSDKELINEDNDNKILPDAPVSTPYSVIQQVGTPYPALSDAPMPVTSEPSLTPQIQPIQDADDGSTTGSNSEKKTPQRRKNYRCRQCSFETKIKEEYWQHQRENHIKDDKLLCCPMCPFVTEYKHHLEYHLRNHFGSKPFVCPVCSYACVSKSMLNSHMKSHTSVYQYRCGDCGYASKFIHSLKSHLVKQGHRAATILNSDGSPATKIDQRTETALTGMKREHREQAKRAHQQQERLVKMQTQRQTMAGIHEPKNFGMQSGKEVPGFEQKPPILPVTDMGLIQQQAKPTDINNTLIQAYWSLLSNSLANLQQNTGLPGVLPQLGQNQIQNAAANALQNKVPFPTAEVTYEAVSPVNERTSSPSRLYKTVTTDSSSDDAPSPPNEHLRNILLESKLTEGVRSVSNSSHEGRQSIDSSDSTKHHTVPSGNLTCGDTLEKLRQMRTLTSMGTDTPKTVSPINLTKPSITEATMPECNRNKSSENAFQQIAPTAEEITNTANETVVSSAGLGMQLQLNGRSPKTTSEIAIAQSNSGSFSQLRGTSQDIKDWLIGKECYHCPYCGIVFTNCVMHSIHMGYHGYNDPYTCNRCGHKSTDAVSFFIHLVLGAHAS